MYNLSNFFIDQGNDPNSALYQGRNPNSSLFDPTSQTGMKPLVPPTAVAGNVATNPNASSTVQSLANPPGAGDQPSGVGPAQTGIGAGSQLDPMARQGAVVKQGENTNGLDFLKKYTGGDGGGGGGLLKLLAAFM